MSNYSAIQGIPNQTSLSTKQIDDQHRYIFTTANGTFLKTSAGGDIMMYSNKLTGVTFSKTHSSITISGKYITSIAPEQRFYTKPNGFIWNNYYFNPELQNAQVLTKSGEYVTILKKAPNYGFDDEINSMLGELGINV